MKFLCCRLLLCSSALIGCALTPGGTTDDYGTPFESSETPEHALDQAWAVWDRARRPLQHGVFYRVSDERAHVVVILATPPRRPSDKALAALGASFAREWRSPVGADGSTLDVAVVLPRTTEARLHEVLALLTHQFYADAREAFAWPLDAVAAGPRDEQLDLELSASSLALWARSSARVRTLASDAGASLELRELLEHPTTGVFRQGQLVLLALAQGAPTCGLDPALRAFATHTDLIVGAVASPYTTLVLARYAPPGQIGLEHMQLESMQWLLAQPRALEQSHGLELLTGVGQGWAPVWLGPGLEDSELGILMLLADHALQVSSLGAEGRFAGFDDPGLRGNPAAAQLTEARARGDRLSLSFDASRAGFIVEDGDLRIYAATRTGALPPAYRSSGKHAFAPLELQAHAFLASSGNHVLARIARYFIFAQIIAELSSLDPCEQTEPADHSRAWTELERLLQAKLAGLRADQLELEGEQQLQAARVRKVLRKIQKEGLGELAALLLQRPTQAKQPLSHRERKILRLLLDDQGHALLLAALGREYVESLFEHTAPGELPLVTPRSVEAGIPEQRSTLGGHLPPSSPQHYVLNERVRAGLPRLTRRSGTPVIGVHPNDLTSLAALTVQLGGGLIKGQSVLRKAWARATSSNEAGALSFEIGAEPETDADASGTYVGWRVIDSELRPELGRALDAQLAVLAVQLRRRGERLEAVVVDERGGAGEVLELGSLAALASYLDSTHAQRDAGRVVIEIGAGVGEGQVRELLEQTRLLGARYSMRVRPHAPALKVQWVRSFDTRWARDRLTLELRLDLVGEADSAQILVLEGPCRKHRLLPLRWWIATRARAGVDERFFVELDEKARALGFEIEIALLNYLDLTFGGALDGD